MDCSDLKYAIFLAGDGNMRLRRNNKGGGERTDPSLFADGAFYAENEKYKDFCRVRGGADDERSVSSSWYDIRMSPDYKCRILPAEDSGLVIPLDLHNQGISHVLGCYPSAALEPGHFSKAAQLT